MTDAWSFRCMSRPDNLTVYCREEMQKGRGCDWIHLDWMLEKFQASQDKIPRPPETSTYDKHISIQTFEEW